MKGGCFQLYNDYRMNDENVKDYQCYEQIIKTIKSRFMTYGYKRIKTSAFEEYDLYSQVKSSINQNEMIKVIDQTGEVLVVRPDVTIPITRQLAQETTVLENERRYFYVQDVFRQPTERGDRIESTQAGVEYFGASSPEADAEVIALACQTLQDLGFNDVKIEIGDAGFFQDLIDDIDLTQNEFNELKNMIQAKNGIDIRPFLDRLEVKTEIAEAIERIPFLYGNPLEVSERAQEIAITEKMKDKINHLIQVYEILKIYGLEQNIVMDLGLINQMGYYSDIIFQGFVEKVGKPVLMGGRYNQLANEFGATIPAIGFACEVDLLVQATGDGESVPTPIDFKINYDEALINESIVIANRLRDQKFSVLSLRTGKKVELDSHYTIHIGKEGNKIDHQGKTNDFSDINDLLKLIEGGI